MIFGEKPVVCSKKCFTPTELYEYVETLLKRASQRDSRLEQTSYYSWLKSRHLLDSNVERHLGELGTMIYKMSPENAAAVAVKLDKITEERDFSVSALLTLIRELLLEQDSMRLIEKNLKRGKEIKDGKRINKVQPELVGRQATVCFIIEML